jgi:pseudouridine-5'-phosphate glycosidase
MPQLSRIAATLSVALMSVSERVRSAAKGDRGDSPVSTAIIVAVLATAALLVTGAILAVTQGWVDRLEGEAGRP